MKDEDVTQTHPLIKPDHLRRLAVIYIRQSTEEQVRENTGSTDFQRSLVTVARSYGWPEFQIQVIDEDLGRSGSSSERRGWVRLQSMIAAEQVGAVFVWNISRLSRQVLDFEIFRMLAASHNTLLYTDGRLVDPADSSDTIFSQITAMIAHFENRKRTEVMSQARLTKAKQGAVVSALPVGWIKGPDGKYDYDPETKDTIRLIIETFWQTRSIRRTVMALAKAGVQIPSNRGRRVYFTKPSLGRVKRILTHPAYAGTYTYGKTQSQPGGPVLATGQSKRLKVPEERWIKTLNHHPPYMSQEQQEEIKSILTKNRFQRRDRPGRGPALSQGLLRCARCKRSFNVSYHRYQTYSYACGWDIEPCTRFTSYEFDKHILAEVFKVLKTPPLEMLRAALEERRNEKRVRLNWIEAERERLEHEERRAKERADLTHDSLRRVHRDALEKLEKVLEEKERFEQKVAIMSSVATTKDESEHELQELCRLVSEVPTLWHHPMVTHQERKEILRCIIDHIAVSATKEKIDATIFWKSGSQTSLSMWRIAGRHNLIRELHAQKLTVLEIKEHLAAGKTSTGQVVDISAGNIYVTLRKLALEPNRRSAGYLSLTKKGAELIGNQAELLESLHRSAIADALGRGLNYRQMTVEFNKKKIRRKSDQPWTARYIRKRWAALNRLQRDRAQTGTASTESLEPFVLRRSA